MRYGIRSITMDDIAREMGVSKKTIYQLFSDKQEMVAEIVRTHCQETSCQMQEVENQTVNAVESLLIGTSHMRQQMSQMHPTFLYDLQKYMPGAWQTFVEFKERVIITTLEGNIRRGQAEGLFRADANPEVLARLRLEQVQMAFDPTIFPSDQFQLANVQEQFIMHYIRGLVTPRGLDFLEKAIVEKSNISLS